MTLDDFIANLTKDQAEHIRELRCGLITHSWRVIAHEVAVKYDISDATVDHGDYVDGNQMAGMDICDAAAKFFGENFQDDPWN